jgi:hypothetical protein
MPPVADMPKPMVAHGQWTAPRPVMCRMVPSVTSWMDTDVPPALPGLVYAKLGDVGYQRFHDFSRWPDGWTGEHSHAVGWGTYRNFQKFLQSAHFVTAQHPPSIFLTDEGYFELTWEDREGRTIDATIMPDGARYFIESMGEEGLIPPDALGEFAARCSQAVF